MNSLETMGGINDAAALAEKTLTNALYGRGLHGGEFRGVVSDDLEYQQLLLTGMGNSSIKQVEFGAPDKNPIDFVKRALLGRIVLSPKDSSGQRRSEIIKGRKVSLLFPAIVPLKQTRADSLDVIATNQPYRDPKGNLPEATAVLLAAQAQAELPEVGSHSQARAGAEAGHFAVLLTTGINKAVYSQVKSGNHVVHDWKDDNKGIIANAAAGGLYETQFGRTSLDGRKFPVFLVDGFEKHTADRKNALPLSQGIGFAAVQEADTCGRRVDLVKQAAESMG